MRIDKITEEQINQIPAWVKRWVDIGLSTEPADFGRATEAALRAYQICKLRPPMVILRMGSPYGATLGGVVAGSMLRALTGNRAKIMTQVWRRVGEQVGQQVAEQVARQVVEQVWRQVERQVGQQVGQQVVEQVWQQVAEQVERQVGEQVGQQVAEQVERQVWRQVEQQVVEQVWQQVWRQVERQVERQVGQQVGQQVAEQVERQVGEQVGQQVAEQVWRRVGEQVGQQVAEQVARQVVEQVWRQVEQQVGQQVWRQVGQQVWRQVGEQVVEQDIYVNRGGAFWAGWGAYVSFLRDRMGWRDPVLERFAIDETLAMSCGWVWWHENILAISDRPSAIRRDDMGRLHNERGPSIAYRDGWSLYHWHGVTVPPEWIEQKDKLTAQMALTWENIEQRRAACEIVGWEHILRELKAKTIDKDEDPTIGELIEVNLPDSGPTRFLRVVCGTGRRFAMPVPREMKTALAANASTYQVDEAVIKSLGART